MDEPRFFAVFDGMGGTGRPATARSYHRSPTGDSPSRPAGGSGAGWRNRAPAARLFGAPSWVIVVNNTPKDILGCIWLVF